MVRQIGEGNSELYIVTPRRRTHILVGDQTGGGHRHGAGKGKNEFPSAWSDDHIIDMITEVANDYMSTKITRRNKHITLIGIRNSVSITTVVNATIGEIVTGYPT